MQELVRVVHDDSSGRYAVLHAGSGERICHMDSQEDADEVADILTAKLALQRGIPLDSVAFKQADALEEILPGLEGLRAASWEHVVDMLTANDGDSQDAALQATQPMDEGLDFEEPQSTAISSSQPHGGDEAAQPAAPAAVPPPQQGGGALGAGTAAAATEALAPPSAAGNAQPPFPEHSTPASAAAAQAVGAAAAAAAAQRTPKGSKRSAQAAGLSPRSGGKQQRVDLLLGLASGRLPVAEQAQPLPQQAQQQRRCRVCDSATFGPASGCWHRHPETKQEWLCHNCYAKALRQFRKKQAQQAQNQAQQPGGMAAAAAAAPAAPAVGPSAAGAAEAAAPAEAARAAWVGAAEAPPLLDHQTQDGAPRDAQQGGTAAEPAPQPPAQQQQQSSAEGVVPPASQPGRSAAAAGASRPLHSHSGTQTGPPAQTAPAAAAAGAIAAAPAAGDAPGPSQYDLYRQAKQALAASGATAELRHAYLQQVFMRLPYQLQRMHTEEVVDMQSEQAWGLLRQFAADELERQRGGGGGILAASPGDTSGGAEHSSPGMLL